MSLIKKSGALFIRRNAQSQSLWVAYPRMNNQDGVLANLMNLQNAAVNVDLTVLSADTSGIELKLPAVLSGIFKLKIQDGEQSFTERIAIQ